MKNKNEYVYAERKRLMFFGLPWTFTKYYIKDDVLTVKKGLFSVIEDDCYMYKIQDVKLITSIFEIILGLGTVICYTGDVTHPEICLKHIKNATEIKNYILKKSEEDRLRRRTINTLNIDVEN